MSEVSTTQPKEIPAHPLIPILRGSNANFLASAWEAAHRIGSALAIKMVDLAITLMYGPPLGDKPRCLRLRPMAPDNPKLAGLPSRVFMRRVAGPKGVHREIVVCYADLSDGWVGLTALHALRAAFDFFVLYFVRTDRPIAEPEAGDVNEQVGAEALWFMYDILSRAGKVVVAREFFHPHQRPDRAIEVLADRLNLKPPKSDAKVAIERLLGLLKKVFELPQLLMTRVIENLSGPEFRFAFQS